MSANSVLPPTGFTTRAESREYLAGIARNELSECQSMLPRLNRRWREARSQGPAVAPEVGHVAHAYLESPVFRLGDVAASGVLQDAEMEAEGHLLLVGDLLVVEHAARRSGPSPPRSAATSSRDSGLVMSIPDTSPTNTGWIWRMDTVIGVGSSEGEWYPRDTEFRKGDDMRPFEGVKILDCTHVLAGPFAAYQLAVLGADVIKVDDPNEPDQSRESGARSWRSTRRAWARAFSRRARTSAPSRST